MEKKSVLQNIDFADSEFRSFELSENNILFLYFTSWDEKLLTVSFSNPIYFSFKLGYHISNLFEVLKDSNLLNETLSGYYEKIPEDHPFKLFQIEDLDDIPIIQIIAESVTGSKGTSIIGFKK